MFDSDEGYNDLPKTEKIDKNRPITLVDALAMENLGLSDDENSESSTSSELPGTSIAMTFSAGKEDDRIAYSISACPTSRRSAGITT